MRFFRKIFSLFLPILPLVLGDIYRSITQIIYWTPYISEGPDVFNDGIKFFKQLRCPLHPNIEYLYIPTEYMINLIKLT